jgi:hypothetical protein
MYHPLAMDQIRVQQEELRRRAEASRWAHEAIESAPRHVRGRRLGRWHNRRRLILRLAFTDTAMRPTCAPIDC